MLQRINTRIRQFLVEDDGPTAVEYMVMVSVIVVVCLITINAIGQATSDSFDNTSNSVSSAVSAS